MLCFSVAAVLGYVGYAQTGKSVDGPRRRDLAGAGRAGEDSGDSRPGADRRRRLAAPRLAAVARRVVRRRAAGGARRDRAVVPARRSDLPGDRADPGDLPALGHLSARHRAVVRRVHDRVALDAARSAHLGHGLAAADAVLAAAPDPGVRGHRDASARCAGTGRWPAAPSSTPGCSPPRRWSPCRCRDRSSTSSTSCRRCRRWRCTSGWARRHCSTAAPTRGSPACAGRWPSAAVAALLAVVAVRGFVDSGVIRRLYRPDQLNTPLVDAGAAIDVRTPKDALLATVEYERYGSNSPMLLYFAHRKGWSFDQVSISAQRHRVPADRARRLLRRGRRLAGPRGGARRRHRVPAAVPARRSALHPRNVPTDRPRLQSPPAGARRQATGHAMLVRR